jgi:hypothetical protein
MTETIEDIAGIKATLRAARMETHCNKFHLDDRTIPALEALARADTDERLHRAVAEATRASEQLGTARETLHSALSLVKAYAPDPIREDEPQVSP